MGDGKELRPARRQDLERAVKNLPFTLASWHQGRILSRVSHRQGSPGGDLDLEAAVR